MIKNLENLKGKIYFEWSNNIAEFLKNYQTTGIDI